MKERSPSQKTNISRAIQSMEDVFEYYYLMDTADAMAEFFGARVKEEDASIRPTYVKYFKKAIDEAAGG